MLVVQCYTLVIYRSKKKKPLSLPPAKADSIRETRYPLQAYVPHNCPRRGVFKLPTAYSTFARTSPSNRARRRTSRSARTRLKHIDHTGSPITTFNSLGKTRSNDGAASLKMSIGGRQDGNVLDVRAWEHQRRSTKEAHLSVGCVF